MKQSHLKRKKLACRFLIFSFCFFFSCTYSETENSVINTKRTSNLSKLPETDSEMDINGYHFPSFQNTLRVRNSFPHDTTAFTQGFVYKDGFFYESTGLYGHSSLRKINPATGEVLAKVDLPRKVFGEGLTIIGDTIYQITWKSRRGFIYDKESMERKGSFTYSTEGWGLTDDGTQLIMSDGTEKLYFLSTENFKVTKVLRVKKDGSRVPMLNELEYIRGKIYCNIWHSDDIVIVDSKSGKVERRINLGELRKRLSIPGKAGALNGIAWKASSDTFFITGKRWSEVFGIKFGSASP